MIMVKGVGNAESGERERPMKRILLARTMNERRQRGKKTRKIQISNASFQTKKYKGGGGGGSASVETTAKE